MVASEGVMRQDAKEPIFEVAPLVGASMGARLALNPIQNRLTLIQNRLTLIKTSTIRSCPVRETSRWWIDIRLANRQQLPANV